MSLTVRKRELCFTNLAEHRTLAMIGKSIRHYEILSKLGEGGMGEVYLARDGRLDREVAIKALPELYIEDSERLTRFEREAKILASLNHPNIGSIYGLEEDEGRRFLVLELVEGETLREWIARGPHPINDGLAIAFQIASALEAAHSKGIIHRDLKPANVQVTPQGQIKVLDFGLARPFGFESEPGSGDAVLPQASTLVPQLTLAGVLLGTAPYMSPEQSRGEAVDKRTDIWAFGCCLFEILTGHRAFEGPSFHDTLTLIRERQPQWDRVPAETPQRIRDLLRRCLSKQAQHRLHDIADARIELADALDPAVDAEPSSGDDAAGAKRRRSALSRLLSLAVAVSLGIAALLVGLEIFSRWQTRPDLAGGELSASRVVVAVFENQTGDPAPAWQSRAPTTSRVTRSNSTLKSPGTPTLGRPS